jgi:hypothetical protein
MRDSSLSEVLKPRRGGLVEARGPGRGGENLVGVNATRGAASEPSGNTDAGGADPLDASILEAAADVKASERKRAESHGRETARRAGQVETPGPLPTGKSSEGEKPMDGSGMQQGRKVTGGIKAPRG